jgi:S1-C subfamily serine protease
VQKQAQASVFMVETRRSFGTGWLIGPGLILTNEHAIEGSLQVIIRQAIEPDFPATVVAFDAQHDIALLRFDASLAPGAEPLPLGRISRDNIAQPLLALGYSSREVNGNGSVASATANVGVLSQVIDLGSRSRGRNLNLVMDVPVDPGDSGGPVLNGNGEVVGMSRAVLEKTDQGQRVVGTFYAVHIDEIREALPELMRGESR